MDPIRVLIVEQYRLVRAGIRSLLQNISGIEVVAEAGNGREALQLIQTEHPDVVLMDTTLPELSGLEATARAVRKFPGVRVIILSVYKSDQDILHALQAGAAGYLIKDASIAELEVAIKAVAGGQAYLSPAISKQVITEYMKMASQKGKASELLTSRQREILQLVAEGRTTKEIASKLNLSVKTVNTHRMDLMQRLGIHDRAGLTRYAIRIGLIESD